MVKLVPLSQVGPYLSNYVVKDSPYTLRQLGNEVLNIHYTNVTKTLNSNKVSLKQIEDIGEFIGLKIRLIVGDGDTSEADQYMQISSLQAEVISLQKELLKYKEAEFASLKEAD